MKQVSKSLPQARKDDQRSVDAALIKSMAAVEDLKAYLSTRFSPMDVVFSSSSDIQG